MRKSFSKKRLVLLVGGILLAGLVFLTWMYYPLIAIGTAYKAKIACSALFVSGRDLESITAEDVGAEDSEDLRSLDYLGMKVDREGETVTVSLFGLARRTAVYRKGVGSTLAIGESVKTLREQEAPVDPPGAPDSGKPWPEGTRVVPPDSPDWDALKALVDSAFEDPDAAAPLRTRAVVVVHEGRIVAEGYAPGFSPGTPLGGWSMTKSVTNTLVGIMIRDGRLNLEDDDLLAVWRSPGDRRSEITLDNLLRMSSGLEFEESYDEGPTDATTMLFRTGDASGFAAAKPLIHDPGSHYRYSSGTTNLLCRVIRETIDDDPEYHAFPYRELFHPIGAHSAIMERDASGTFVGSSFMYATARDWARLGLLYDLDGVWIDGTRILPEGWVDYSRTPAPASKGDHGAQFWIHFAGPKLRNAMHMSGYEGQFVTVIPEENLVVVRLGLTLQEGAWSQEEFVSRILEALPE